MKDLGCDVSVCVLLHWFLSSRIVAPLGLERCHVSSELLRSRIAHLIAAWVQFGCINCQQGNIWTCPTSTSATAICRVYTWLDGFCFQARTNHVNGHTGQLSSVSVLLSWAGSLGLTFETLQVATTVSDLTPAVNLFLISIFLVCEGEGKLLVRCFSPTLHLLQLCPDGSDLLFQEQETHP